MRSLINLGTMTKPDIPYNVKISTKADIIDQKRGLIELRPGYHLVIRVVPKVVHTSEDFENFEAANYLMKQMKDVSFKITLSMDVN